ncbi:MAG TPA: FAD-binding oxidoreductase [Polyangiaceae bacterium]|nr:FAD-binding oxidoreductase [Polyangiaceae bacterium]
MSVRSPLAPLRAAPAELRSFDGTERTRGSRVRPERRHDLHDAVATGGPFIARGAGLSYCAASMGDGVTSIDMSRLDRVLAFDSERGEITVEPGISIGALTELLGRRGRWLAPLPGYPTISVGGCVAFDVHGKSQFHSGNFGEWVTRLTLVHPAHGEITCSREQQRDVFDLTVGGMGLTGVINSVTLKTVPLPGDALEVESVAVRDVHEAVALMQQSAGSVDCIYSWHNLQRSSGFGPGVVFRERFVSARAAKRGRAFLPLWARAPVGFWTRPSAALALGAYGALQRDGRKRVLSLGQALFPIQGLELYYFAFGPQGLREYQLIVPEPRWPAFVDDLQALLASARLPITLASLKLFKGERRFLRFNGTGICLALDVPAAPAAQGFFAALDELALEHEASVNIAKDSRIDAETCRRLFPEYAAFQSGLQAYDPARLCQSRLRERIGV